MEKKDKTAVLIFRVIAVVIGLIGILCLFALPAFGVIVLAVAAVIWYQTIRIKRDSIKKTTEKAEADAMAVKKAAAAAEEKARREAAEQEAAREQKKKEMEASREATKNNPEEYERLHNMCCDIAAEYKELISRYADYEPSSDSAALKMAGILGECYRKMDVLATTILWHDCYNGLDPYDEMEKIEKKAKTLVNTYAKYNHGDYIDLGMFTDDLDFISDYIYEKEEKLNK